MLCIPSLEQCLCIRIANYSSVTVLRSSTFTLLYLRKPYLKVKLISHFLSSAGLRIWGWGSWRSGGNGLLPSLQTNRTVWCETAR